ncbi:MAG: TetR/AcrR family transcriptional regulator [Solirubrobacteraceae bacterium]
MGDTEPQIRRQRPYRSSLRRQQAETTRTRIALAARHLFRLRGWTQTRMSDVAAQAGVSEASVYATYGSKAGLARALVDAVEASADVLRSPSQIVATDPTDQLAALVESDRRLFEDGGDVVALLRDAGRAEPDLLHAYRQGRRHGDRLRRETFAAWPATALRDHLAVEDAVDAYAALCNIDVYRELTDERHWTPEQVQAWWTDTLTMILLD